MRKMIVNAISGNSKTRKIGLHGVAKTKNHRTCYHLRVPVEMHVFHISSIDHAVIERLPLLPFNWQLIYTMYVEVTILN